MLAPALRRQIQTHNGSPVLNSWFESSVRGLYFVGFASLNSFGHRYRFVAGCKAAAPRVVRSIARERGRVRVTSLRPRAKHAIARAVSLTGLDARAAARMHRDVPFTVSYHSVVEKLNGNARSSLPAMRISAAMLEQHLDWLARNFEIVSLDQLGRNGNGGGKSRPLAAVTFDDGYSDVYYHAFPILKRKGIPAAIFVVTDLVGTPEPPIHERLYSLLSKALRSALTQQQLVGIIHDVNHGIAKESLEEIAADPFDMTRFLLRALDQTAVLQIMKRLSEYVPAETEWPRDLQPLSWEMLAEMRAAGMTIGSHSRTHAFLAKESDERARDETATSRRVLYENLGAPAEVFSYPGGSFNRSVIRAVADAGYRYAFTDCNHRDAEYPLLTLPRKTMWERSCVDPSGAFSPEIMSCHALSMFERFSDCSGDH